MRLLVKKLLETPNNRSDFVCEDDMGNDHNVDLFVDGTLPDGTTPESLIGREVDVDYLSIYMEIANGVKLLQPPKTDA
jgi:hypothetical protein